MNRHELLKAFKKHSELVNFGTTDNAPTAKWIEKAEQALTIELPEDYKWFLNTFGGGEISGEEIYSIYGLPFDEVAGGDIVYRNIIVENNIKFGRLVISNTDFGEEFYFNLNDMNKIYLSFGNNAEWYADDFIEYLYKRLFSYI